MIHFICVKKLVEIVCLVTPRDIVVPIVHCWEVFYFGLIVREMTMMTGNLHCPRLSTPCSIPSPCSSSILTVQNIGPIVSDIMAEDWSDIKMSHFSVEIQWEIVRKDEAALKSTQTRPTSLCQLIISQSQLLTCLSSLNKSLQLTESVRAGHGGVITALIAMFTDMFKLITHYILTGPKLLRQESWNLG